ncbi:MAG: hypothetical protein IPK97_08210 [Ahniella sp.]|nr:hypothetical protein [Ahniella sp.]
MRGYTLQELMLVMLLGVLITASGMPLVRRAMTELEDKDLVQLLSIVISLVHRDFEQSTSYAGVSTANLVSRVPSQWVLDPSTLRHPLGGTLTVSVDAADSGRFVLSLAVQREDTCERAVMSSWPLFDLIRVDGVNIKTQAMQVPPGATQLAAACSPGAHQIQLVGE